MEFRNIQVVTNSPARSVVIADGVEVDLPCTVTGEIKADDREFGYELEMDLIEDLGLVRPVSVKLSSRDGKALRSGDMRTVPLAELTANALHTLLKSSTGILDNVIDEEERDYLKAMGPIDRSLKGVAQTYRLAQMLGFAPAKTVEQIMDLSPATATRWIRKAREKGFLDGKSE